MSPYCVACTLDHLQCLHVYVNALLTCQQVNTKHQVLTCRHFASMPPFVTGILPCMPVEEQLVIGLIGMEEMGTIYVRRLVEAGWKRCACQAGHAQVLSGAVLILGSTCVICRRTVWHCTCRCKVTPCATSCVHAEQSRGCAGMVSMTVLWDSHLVTHKSDFIIYSIKAKHVLQHLRHHRTCHHQPRCTVIRSV